MKSIWTGTISFGLVTIPVGLYSALEGEEHVSFRLLHKKDLAPIKYRKFCSKEDVEVEQDEIVKGYEVKKNRFAVVEEKDIEKVQQQLGEDDRTIEVLKFVDVASIDPLSIEKPYFLAPEKGGERAYSVLREALLEAKKVGIVRLFFRTRPILAAMIPGKKALSLAALRPFEEMRDPADLPITEKPKKEAEVKLARMLVDRMSDEWDPAEHPDEYKKALEKLLSARKTTALEAEGKEKEKEGGKVVSLVEALERSVRSRKTSAGRRASRRAG